MEMKEICRENGVRYQYTLWLSSNQSNLFQIAVEGERERVLGWVRGKLSDVAVLFDQIVRGEVPGYILPEIIDDFKKRDI